MKADLHNHGICSFHQPYFFTQLKGKNLAEAIVDSAMNKGLDIAALTTHYPIITKDSSNPLFCNNRFDYFLKKLKESGKYTHDKLGDNILIVERNNKRLYVVNGQTVMIRDGDKRIDHLVVGSNKIPNLKNLDYTVSYCVGKGLIHMAEHPLSESHGGMGRKNLEKYIGKITAIEGHNTQLIFPTWMEKFPVINQFTKTMNNKTKRLAGEYSKPWVATSDAHSLKSIGKSFIGFDDELLEVSSEDKFWSSLKDIISLNKFKNHCDYAGLIDFMSWVPLMMITDHLDKNLRNY